MSFEVDGKTIATNDNGYLDNVEDWTKAVGQAIADSDQLEMTEQHLVHVQVPPLPQDLAEPASVVLGDVVAALQDLCVQLPEVPVGRGAVWTLAQQVHQDGVIIDQLRTVTLTARKGSSLILDITGTDSVAKLEQGSALGLDTFDGRVQGRVWLDLSRPLPQAAELTHHTTVQARWSDAQQVEHVTIATGEVTLSWTTRDHKNEPQDP